MYDTEILLYCGVLYEKGDFVGQYFFCRVQYHIWI